MEFEYTCPSLWKGMDDQTREAVFAYGERYKAFLDAGKTERECAATIVEMAHDKGFVDFAEVVKSGKMPTAGTKIVYNHKNKAVVLFVIGERPLEDGLHIVGSHIDAPRLDLKGHPLYEEGELALLKTHYYGGIKKYQWTCMPLALHGLVYTADGTAVNVRFGDEAGDPVLYITDLLPHLGKSQNEKKLAEAITAEQLNAIIGHIPLDDEDCKEPIKAAVLRALHDKYGMVEEDLLLAELELVPAQNAVDVGLDRGLIAAHGHDDRSCTYAALEAMFDTTDIPEHTAVCLFVDKEEIGSVGNTSMSARYFENLLAELFALAGKHDTELSVRRALAASQVLSADVTAALDPTFPEVMDRRNTAFLGKGVSLCKFTGARGKSGSNDANAEFLAELRRVFKHHDVPWQAGELGRVDEGGGGTIAYILAERGAEVVDCGVPMLSMHAPVELVSKADIYFTMRAYRAFFEGVR
jgi:aspartyl aminopeptidase